MPKRHPPEVKAAAIAAVASGERPADVAKRFGISQGLLHGWCERELPPVELSEVSRSVYARERTRELIAATIYDSILDTLTAIRSQLQAASREEWLAEQKAGDVAALLDREFDGAIRLLAGFRPAEPDAQQHAIDGATVDATSRAADDGDGVAG